MILKLSLLRRVQEKISAYGNKTHTRRAKKALKSFERLIMVTEKITLKNPERFSKPHVIKREKLEAAARVGSDIATIPYKVFEQMLKHPLTTIGIEKFLEEWKSMS